MVWLFVALGIIVILVTIYFLFPIFKKIYLKRASGKKNKKDKKAEVKGEKVDETNPHVFKNEGGLFDDKKEDPDTKVNQENLEIKELFEETPKDYFEESEDNNLTIKQNFDELFGSDSNSYKNKNDNSFDYISDGNLEDDEEIKDLLEQIKTSSHGNNLAEEIEELPPVIKALMLSNIFDKKDI